MAGSFFNPELTDDSTVSSRLQALILLADQLSEPIAILDPDLKLIYSNSSTSGMEMPCPLLPDQVGESLQDDEVKEPRCAVCPAEQHLGQDDSLLVNADSSSTSQDHRCPFPTSFPVPGGDGRVGFVVMMGKHPHETKIWRGMSQGQPYLRDQSTDEVALSQPTLIGQSDPMQQLMEMIRLVAQSESTVLIEGESGTGKELVARTIHNLSPRRNHPFVVVECSSLPETLLESELFGHVRGAFTGAVVDRKGLFEEAKGGTIFLDEIADTIPTFQAKLLRVLQEGEIKPVGGNRPIKVNVRVISACNRSLTALVEKQAFRSDLYYRLAILPLGVPALRARQGDIPLLAQYFLEQSCDKNNKRGLSIPQTTMQALLAHDWPGNVRELENVIERAVVIAQSSTLSIRDVFGDVRIDIENEQPGLGSLSKAARQAIEKQEILKVLQETNGDKTHTARRLKISRANLYNKLKAYNIR
ncbi:MAG: sigma-54 dependent transcriptional regulator [Nitrospirales bacterium]|nr:sigma 54-interacting transcriptional regulator [Nitrospira sp.]MDR4502541.1 sigma-54 dependent transcriptional regulator [Nitrospirales bacterium]